LCGPHCYFAPPNRTFTYLGYFLIAVAWSAICSFAAVQESHSNCRLLHFLLNYAGHLWVAGCILA
jgi:hypothetical protein